MADLKELTILMRGRRRDGQRVAHRLWRAGFRLVMLDLPAPLAVRRRVSFCEAVHQGSMTVEDATAILIDGPEQADAVWKKGRLPLLVDPEMTSLKALNPDILIEATLSKKNDYGLNPNMAPLVIALGPGFQSPKDAHYVIETNRGPQPWAGSSNPGRPSPTPGTPATSRA